MANVKLDSDRFVKDDTGNTGQFIQYSMTTLEATKTSLNAQSASITNSISVVNALLVVGTGLGCTDPGP